MIEFSLNGTTFRFRGDPGTPLLWVLRDEAGLTGTKFGCGAGLCGACAVHVDGQASRSCVTTVAAVKGKSVTTIEGLGRNGLHPVQQAWLEEDVPQCGYCQAGQIMTAAAWLADVPQPSHDDIEAMQTPLCRCGSYARIRRAIFRAAELQRDGAVTLVQPEPTSIGGEDVA